MSDQATGGDGSVRWSVEVENVKQHQSEHHDNGRLRHHGIDKSGEPGAPFTISIRVPSHFNSVEDYLSALRDPRSEWGVRAMPDGEKRIYFNIPIERMTPEQIRVSWGSSSHVIRHHPKP